MKKINSFDEYIEITKQAQAMQMKNFNCYLMPDEINLLIQNEKLFYLRNDSTLEIIAKHGRYFKVYFYGTEGFSFIESQDFSMPIITDITYSFDMKEKDMCLKKKLEKMGFAVNATSSRMSSHNFEFKLPKIDYNLEKLSLDEVVEVLKIWEENFNPIKNLIYTEEEIVQNKDSIFVLKSKEGLVVGAMEIVLNSRSGMIQHIAIKKEFHHKGLGSCLEVFYIKLCKSLGIQTLLLYTIDSNLNAQNFHKKFGFEFDGKHNIQMIYRR